MILTQELAEFIWDKTRAYSKAVHIAMPEVLLTFDEIEDMEGTFKKAQKIMSRCLGMSWSKKENPDQKKDIIFINVDASDYLAQILDTVAHEVIHLKYTDLRHGRKFQDKINELMINAD